MKTLKLTIKREWFDLIKSGVKKEEYREIKPYWTSRLTLDDGTFREYTHVEFRNGYQPNSPTLLVECKGIEIGHAVSEWSNNWQGRVYIIKIGKICSYSDN